MQPGGIWLRSQPNTDNDDTRIGKINKCGFVSILEGPLCIDGYNFYKVKPDGSREGWAAESDKSRPKYWLVPVLDDKKCNLPPIFAEGATATSDHGTPGFVRKVPQLSATPLTWTIRRGDIVKIIEGPICNETYIWYKVHGGAHSEAGWTIEGHGNEYYFEIPDSIKMTNDETAEATC